MNKEKILKKLNKNEPKSEYDFDKDPKKAELERQMLSIADKVKKEGIK